QPLACPQTTRTDSFRRASGPPGAVTATRCVAPIINGRRIPHYSLFSLRRGSSSLLSPLVLRSKSICTSTRVHVRLTSNPASRHRPLTCDHSYIMCFGSREDGAAKKTREIDAQLHKDEKVMQRQVKLLLLGAGESGKSTILKQMRLIYTKDGFSKSEKEEWRIIIFNNILDGLRMTVDAMQEFGVEFSNEKNEAHLAVLNQEIDLRPYEPIPIQYLQAFQDLWKDQGIQKAIERGNEYALHDNLS
ncbi:hypothetical protein DH86_00001068, partial [Scytalidium sp. 3C]